MEEIGAIARKLTTLDGVSAAILQNDRARAIVSGSDGLGEGSVSREKSAEGQQEQRRRKPYRSLPVLRRCSTEAGRGIRTIHIEPPLSDPRSLRSLL